MRATLVGGSLHGTLIDVTEPDAPVRRFFRRDGVSWFECYEPAPAHRAGDGELVFRFSVPPEDRPDGYQWPALTLPDDGERRARRDRRATPSAGRRVLVSADPGSP
jgi:hypothetical protein